MMSDDFYAAWRDHQWVAGGPRQFDLESGQTVLQRRCSRCGRDFVVDLSSGAHHAIYVSIFSFYRLHDEVTQRWVGRPCPGKRLPADEDDRKKPVTELRITWQGSPEE
jgi:hypothetical protein